MDYLERAALATLGLGEIGDKGMDEKTPVQLWNEMCIGTAKTALEVQLEDSIKIANSQKESERIGYPISKEELIEYRAKLFKKLDQVLIAKGNDYNAEQQNSGDTLFNLRVAAILGVVRTPEDGILVRLLDKMMRLVSLTRPSTIQKVMDESVDDTIGDAINYLTYIGKMRAKRRGEL